MGDEVESTTSYHRFTRAPHYGVYDTPASHKRDDYANKVICQTMHSLDLLLNDLSAVAGLGVRQAALNVLCLGSGTEMTSGQHVELILGLVHAAVNECKDDTSGE
jgi:hypothetical protein